MSKTVAVIGDSILDEYVFYKSVRVSPESLPGHDVPVCEIDSREYRLGGASNVMSNVYSMGADCLLFSPLCCAGSKGKELKRLVSGGYCSNIRPTVKTRHFIDGKMSYRVDEDCVLSDFRIPAKWDLPGAYRLSSAMIVSDYGKGVVSGHTIADLLEIIEGSPKKIPVIVDPYGVDLGKYRGVATVLKLNEGQLAKWWATISDRDNSAQNRAIWLSRYMGDVSVIVTRGADGAMLIESGIVREIPAPRVEVVDVTGAGDVFAATLAVSLADGKSLFDAAGLAVLAASASVRKLGTVAVTKDELFREVVNL